MTHDLSILQLVMNASWTVKLVMLLLVGVSIASWAAIFRKLFSLKRVNTMNDTHGFPPHAIAIVGLGGRFPGASDLDAFWRHHPFVEMRIAAIKCQRPRPFRIGGGEQHRHRRAFGGAKQRRAAAACGVHHRAHIVHARFETGQVMRVDTVGKTRAALVEQDQP